MARAPVLPLLAVAAMVLAGCVGGDGQGGGPTVADPASADGASASNARLGAIVGVVTDGDAPLAGAQASLRGTGRATTTDVNGTFAFADLANGTYELVVELFGFEPAQVPVVLRPGETKDLDVPLKRVETIDTRIEKWTFDDGFLVCGAGAAELSLRCPGVSSLMMDELRNRDNFTVPVEALAFEALVVEVVWSPTVATPSGLCLEVALGEEEIADACGDGRVLWRTQKGDSPGLGLETVDAVKVELAVYAAWQNAQGQASPSLVAQQPFTLHAHAFYGVAAPAEYSPAAGQ